LSVDLDLKDEGEILRKALNSFELIDSQENKAYKGSCVVSLSFRQARNGSVENQTTAKCNKTEN
jgi:hypothetical protein